MDNDGRRTIGQLNDLATPDFILVIKKEAHGPTSLTWATICMSNDKSASQSYDTNYLDNVV